MSKGEKERENGVCRRSLSKMFVMASESLLNIYCLYCGLKRLEWRSRHTLQQPDRDDTSSDPLAAGTSDYLIADVLLIRLAHLRLVKFRLFVLIYIVLKMWTGSKTNLNHKPGIRPIQCRREVWCARIDRRLFIRLVNRTGPMKIVKSFDCDVTRTFLWRFWHLRDSMSAWCMARRETAQ